MDFKSPGGLSTGQTDQAAELQEQKAQGSQASMKQASWGRAWVLKPQGLRKSWLGLGVGALPGAVPMGFNPGLPEIWTI